MANTQKTQSNDATAKTGNAGQDNVQNKTENTGTTGQVAASNSQLSEKIGNIVSGDTGAVKDVLKQAKESTGEIASQAYGVAAEKATSVIEEQKSNLAQGLTSVADSIRQMGDNMRGGSSEQAGIAGTTAKYSESVASQVEQFSRYLEKKDLRDVANDIERFARRNPAVFLGGAFALGLLAARFLKSANPNQALMRRERYDNEGVYLPENFDDQVKSVGSRSNFSTGVSGAGDFSTGQSNKKDFATDISSVDDFTTNVSDTKDATKGTSGTKNTTTGSSNKGG